MTMKKTWLGLMSAGVIAMAPLAFADGWGDDAGAAEDQHETQEQEGFDQGQQQDDAYGQGQQDEAYGQGEGQGQGQGQQDQGFDQGQGQDDAYGQDPYGEEEDDQPDEW